MIWTGLDLPRGCGLSGLKPNSRKNFPGSAVYITRHLLYLVQAGDIHSVIGRQDITYNNRVLLQCMLFSGITMSSFFFGRLQQSWPVALEAVGSQQDDLRPDHFSACEMFSSTSWWLYCTVMPKSVLPKGGPRDHFWQTKLVLPPPDLRFRLLDGQTNYGSHFWFGWTSDISTPSYRH